MATTFSIAIAYALDVCINAQDLPCAFRESLLALPCSTDDRLWCFMRGIVHCNLFAVFDTCIRYGFHPATARDSCGRNVLFYATFALRNGNFSRWFHHFAALGARLEIDASGRDVLQYIAAYADTFNATREQVNDALQYLQHFYCL